MQNVNCCFDSSGQRRTGPPNEPGISLFFSSPFLSPMEFWIPCHCFLLAFLLSAGYLISDNIVDLTAQTLG